MAADLTPEFYWLCLERIDYSGLEEPYRQLVRNYVERGLHPGSALRFALEGSIKALLIFQDPATLERLVWWIHQMLPTPLWGSRRKVRAWIKLAHNVSARCTGPACRSGISAIAP